MLRDEIVPQVEMATVGLRIYARESYIPTYAGVPGYRISLCCIVVVIWLMKRVVEIVKHPMVCDKGGRECGRWPWSSHRRCACQLTQ